MCCEIDAVERLDERRDEMPAGLLAVGHDVDAGVLLVAQHEAHRVALALGERVALEAPGRPQLVRGSASHEGLGRLPAIVVCRSLVIAGTGVEGEPAQVPADYSVAPPADDAKWVRPLDQLALGPRTVARRRPRRPRRPIAPFMAKVLFSDYEFPDLDIERDLFDAAGVELATAQCKTEDDVIAAARDCAGILLQYAPITERVVAALPKLGIVSRHRRGLRHRRHRRLRAARRVGRQLARLRRRRGRDARAWRSRSR